MFPNTLTVEPCNSGIRGSTSFHGIHFGKCYFLGLRERLCQILHPVTRDHQSLPHWKESFIQCTSLLCCLGTDSNQGLVRVCLSLSGICRPDSPPPQPCSGPCLLLLFPPSCGSGDLASISLTPARSFWDEDTQPGFLG